MLGRLNAIHYEILKTKKSASEFFDEYFAVG